jgi:hypothetical protein
MLTRSSSIHALPVAAPLARISKLRPTHPHLTLGPTSCGKRKEPGAPRQSQAIFLPTVAPLARDDEADFRSVGRHAPACRRRPARFTRRLPAVNWDSITVLCQPWQIPGGDTSLVTALWPKKRRPVEERRRAATPEQADGAPGPNVISVPAHRPHNNGSRDAHKCNGRACTERHVTDLSDWIGPNASNKTR